jgi:hypothetical protein
MLPHTILALRSDTHSLGRSAKPSSERSVGRKESHRERRDILTSRPFGGCPWVVEGNVLSISNPGSQEASL